MTQTEIIKQVTAFLEQDGSIGYDMTGPQGQAIVQILYDIWKDLGYLKTEPNPITILVCPAISTQNTTSYICQLLDGLGVSFKRIHSSIIVDHITIIIDNESKGYRPDYCFGYSSEEESYILRNKENVGKYATLKDCIIDLEGINV